MDVAEEVGIVHWMDEVTDTMVPGAETSRDLSWDKMVPDAEMSRDLSC